MLENVCTDSRQAKAGDVFFAIQGERFDGHEFLDQVAAKGVAAVVVEKKKIPALLPDCAVLIVDDVRAAFGKLAAAYRKDFGECTFEEARQALNNSTQECSLPPHRRSLALSIPQPSSGSRSKSGSTGLQSVFASAG